MNAELRDGLEFLFPDSEVGRPARRSVSVDVARGGTAAVTVLLNGLEPGELLRLAVRGRGLPDGSAQWFRLLDVPVEENTGLSGFTERTGGVNEFVIRRAPFRVYDAMVPVQPPVRVESATLAVRLHVPIPADSRPGLCSWVIEVGSGAGTVELAFEVRVHSAVIPPVGANSFPYTNWFSMQHMADRHGLRAWSEPHWRMMRRYADLMVHGRQNTFRCPLSDFFERHDGGWRLNGARLRRIVKTFSAAGMHIIEGGHFAHRRGGEWKAPTFELDLGGAQATSAEGDAAISAIARQLVAEIDRNGWRGRWVQHAADEPIVENAADYRILAGMVHKYMPGIPLLDATMTTAIAGSVDIWCPKPDEYTQNREFFESRQTQGDRVWFYTCCAPGGPWLNRLLDQEALRPALYGWAASLFDLDGFLHWGLNHSRFGAQPFEPSVVPLGTGTFLPAGDTHIVYSGSDGPWSSVRLEAQREGFEDYELLRRLKQRDPRSAAAIARRIIQGLDRYTKDLRAFRRVRRILLERL